MTTTFVREYERVPLSIKLDVCDLATGGTCLGRSIDLSRGGISLFAARFIPKGSPIRVGLLLAPGGNTRRTYVAATVVRSEAEGSGCVLGAVFDRPLSPASQPALCELLDSR